MNFILHILALYLGGLPVFAGTTGATHILTRGPGAEAAALGSSVIPTIHDPSALYWNPAGLAHAGGMVMGEHLFLYDGARYDFIGLTVPSPIGSFGLGALQLNRGNIVARSAIDDPGTKVSNTQTDYLVGFARRLGEHLSLGGAANILHFNLAGYRDLGIGVDLGGQAFYPTEDIWALKQPFWSIGAVLKNLVTPRIKLLDEDEALPRELRGGLSLSFKTLSRGSFDSGAIRSDRASVSLSLGKVSGEPAIHTGLGLSYTFEDMVVLRLGYDAGVSGGIGLHTRNGRFVLDYALEDKPLSKNHRFTVSYRFLEPKARPVPSHKEVDTDYARTLARAQALSQEHHLRGQALFKDSKYGASLEPLRLAALLDPDSGEKREFYKRALEVARREKLRRLSAEMEANLMLGGEANAYKAIARMLDLKPTNQPELREILRKLRGRVPEAELDAVAPVIIEERRPEILRLSSVGLASEALRLAANLELHRSSRTAEDVAQLKQQILAEGQALRSRLEAEVKEAQRSKAHGKAYRTLLELQRAFPDETEIAKKVEAAREAAGSGTYLKLKEKLYLRRLYLLAAIQYANRNLEGARDLLEEILRRGGVDRDALALENAMLRANVEEDQLQ